ncbi:VOC family protein [Paenibacillus xerothermodurans]|uniref:VOC family protein n=1 Tax=Paenibacillus xerothermodurans TaxID=1977292 RepID=A0A2W1NMH6_PAEXE|nr:VOC family protein [Paenibacillus xerothermodurans]PZE20163.1 VOC family protein [Paenibacillus xerothermodurans]
MGNITPYLRVRNAAEAIEFYKKAFDAREEYQLRDPRGRVGHAEITIHGSLLQISDEFPDFRIVGPESIGGTTVAIHLQVVDVDTVFEQAFAAGASVVAPVQDQFFGERTGSLLDPFGHHWIISTTIEELSPQEMQVRYSLQFIPDESQE